MRPNLTVVGLLVLSLALVGSLWVVPYLPTNDGPEWVFAAHIENHFGDPATPYYAERYVPALQCAARGFLLLYEPLEASLGWQHGLQVALSIIALVVAWAFVALVHALDPRRTELGFLGFPLALSWTFYMGFWSFSLALGGGLLLLAFIIRQQRRMGALSTVARLLVSVSLLLIAIAHVFAAVLTGLTLTCLLVAEAPRGRRWVEMGKVTLMGLPAGALAAMSYLVGRVDQPQAAFCGTVGWLPWRDALAVLPQTLWPGSLARAIAGSVLVVAAALAATLRARRAETTAADRGLTLAACLCLVATVATPVDIPGWQFFSQRFATPGVAFALALLPLERLRPPALRVATGALFVAAILALASSYGTHLRIAARCADAIAGLSAPIHRTESQLTVALAAFEGETARTFEGEVPMMNPLLHIGALYAAVEGGLIPDVFTASSATYPFTLRPGYTKEPVPDFGYYAGSIHSADFHTNAAFRHEIDDDLATYGMPYQGVVVTGARPDDVALWRDRGYVADWARGATFLGHFEPCGIELTTPTDPMGHEPTFDIGWGRSFPIEGVHFKSAAGTDGLTHFDLSPAPCGEVFVRARWAPAAPGSPARTCGNADRDGTIVAHVTRGSRRVACEAIVTSVAAGTNRPSAH